ncbi:MAG: type III-B CRISPR module-associated protein Cmr5 [Acidobacteria bacterium]|nr:type III-B CRISPR module-associated protein Cmr5 [Acidobacteriota bacterium]MDW7984897.1 type III-B CRISPR module-associated protein Cmr5 [Acidobacteriota bacterium]
MRGSPYRTRSQEMAHFALERVKLQRENLQEQGRYKSYATKLPTMIINNGLAATLAFMKDKGEQWGQLYADLQEWFRKIHLLSEQQDLLEDILNRRSAVEYRRWTREALAVAEWIKRFASAELQGSAEE